MDVESKCKRGCGMYVGLSFLGEFTERFEQCSKWIMWRCVRHESPTEGEELRKANESDD